MTIEIAWFNPDLGLMCPNLVGQEARQALPAVLILESPRDTDFVAGKLEGEALSRTLSTATIYNRFCFVTSKNALTAAFTAAVPLFMANANAVPVLSLHISAHGNEDGLVLTNGEAVAWSELGALMTNLARGIFANPEADQRNSSFTLCLSSCKGLYGTRIWTTHPTAAFAVVGPVVNASYEECLTGYVAYYHHVQTLGSDALRAVLAMNAACGRDIFNYVGHDGAIAIPPPAPTPPAPT